MSHGLDGACGQNCTKRISINVLEWESFNMKVFLYLVSLKNSTETNPKIDDFLCCLNSLGLYHKEGKSKAKAHVVMRQCQCWIFPQHLICWCQSVVLWMDLNQHCWPFLRIGHPFWVRLRHSDWKRMYTAVFGVAALGLLLGLPAGLGLAYLAWE